MEHLYFHYSDLSKFDKVSNSSRLLKKTSTGIECEYYSLPVTNFFQKVKGYSSYTYKYDINAKDNIVRIGLKSPKYLIDGKEAYEKLKTFDEKYSDAFLKKLHTDYVNVENKYNAFAKYPLGKNKMADAYKLLVPYARKYQLFPSYPSDSTVFWFIQGIYQDEKLTFCISGKNNHFYLFDVLLGDKQYENMAKKLAATLKNTKISICTNANLALFSALEKEFSNAKFVFDIFQIPYALKHIKGNIEIKRKLRQGILDMVQKPMYVTKDTLDTMMDVLCDLYKDSKSEEIKDFLSNLEKIEKRHPEFIISFFKNPEYHFFLPYFIFNILKKDYSKNKGFGVNRLTYILKTTLHDLYDLDVFVPDFTFIDKTLLNSFYCATLKPLPLSYTEFIESKDNYPNFERFTRYCGIKNTQKNYQELSQLYKILYPF